ncbi:LysR family transcriptional regulator [Piscinibacter koreensis]|uniref:LysR family transcriptional regulator n=1 Tax=Piscinibacter koreensis TaxID=2742824 RepID=A0A7Y6TWI3_9BURK|nr:LysR family transcriptional regulator [Schlegelella koreensis]NUZ06047.1 LysR family transcriptional regulator [Schlegelella koreensis]
MSRIDIDDAGGLPDVRLTVQQLRVFVATAQAGSTHAAADRVARSQSAASTTLAALESTLGTKLFDRIGRRLVLNESGRALLPRAVSLLEQAGAIEGLFAGAPVAPLRMAASLTIGEYVLPQLVADWRAAHPGSAVSLAIANTRAVIDAVVAFEADVGFIEGPQTHRDLIAQPWLPDELVIVAAAGHPLAGTSASTQALQGAEWALREPGSGTREVADRWLVEHLGRVKLAFELGSPETIKRLVACTSVLGMLSRYVVLRELADGTLAEVRTRHAPPARRFAMIVHRDKQLGAGTREFVARCAQGVGASAPRSARGAAKRRR